MLYTGLCQPGTAGRHCQAAQETFFLDVLNRTVAGESVYPDSSPRVTLGLAGSEEFTVRELEVLRMMTTGMSNAKIAEKDAI